MAESVDKFLQGRCALTSQERFLLVWLSKEESSAYGECCGFALNVLINTGLAETSKVPPSDYDQVSLTALGTAVAAAIAKAEGR